MKSANHMNAPKSTDIKGPGYRYADDSHSPSHAYLFPAITTILNDLHRSGAITDRIFDLGCGNGTTANFLHGRGHQVLGVDPSTEGVAVAKANFPHLRIEKGDSYQALSDRFGRFPIVLNLEVIEHVYSPRQHMGAIWSLLEPNGYLILSTPYHGYLKNLALALTGKLDQHFTALWDHGHIKFWSIATLSQLIRECGLETVKIVRVGRFGPLAKSMIFVARKPA